jgi:hypothetical protein
LELLLSDLHLLGIFFEFLNSFSFHLAQCLLFDLLVFNVFPERISLEIAESEQWTPGVIQLLLALSLKELAPVNVLQELLV